jgi:HSP20 family protein
MDFFRMSPFGLFRRMSEEMERFFRETGGQDFTRSGWAPPIEVSVHDGKFMVSADLAGVNPQDLKVETREDSLVIEGERKFEHEEERGRVHRSEFRYGRFHRTIPLPEGVKPEEAKARFENGVLEITMPMEQEATKARQVPIEGAKPTATSEKAEKTEKPEKGNVAA